MRAAEVAFRLPPHIAEQFSDQIRRDMIKDAESFARWDVQDGDWFSVFAKSNAQRAEHSEVVRNDILEHVPSYWASSNEVLTIVKGHFGARMSRDRIAYHLRAMCRDGRVLMKKEAGKCYWRKAG